MRCQVRQGERQAGSGGVLEAQCLPVKLNCLLTVALCQFQFGHRAYSDGDDAAIGLSDFGYVPALLCRRERLQPRRQFVHCGVLCTLGLLSRRNCCGTLLSGNSCSEPNDRKQQKGGTAEERSI